MKTKSLTKALCTAFSSAILIAIIFSLCVSASAYDGEGTVYRNTETGYSAVILDDDDLLTDNEERQLVEYMIPITEFGDIAF